jgi:hypothetical protein
MQRAIPIERPTRRKSTIVGILLGRTKSGPFLGTWDNRVVFFRMLVLRPMRGILDVVEPRPRNQSVEVLAHIGTSSD